ncbi:MAG: hypothetical protein HY801_10465 [Candidatus Lindowbacteria bacterium]|nr:hypothetical protein [Candidatus Lindowbacteria bacterium]
MYRFQFTSTLEDLLAAEKAESDSKSMRAPFRWAIVSFGFALIAAGVATFDMAKYGWTPVLKLALGLGIVVRFSVQPFLRRRRIKKTNAPRKDITLEFAEDCLRIEVSGVGKFTRWWDEVLSVNDTEKGVTFHFSDGIANWLPNRVFTDAVDRDNFIRFVSSHLPQGRTHK